MDNQTIIVKKIKKAGHGHHGGAWKVAFADFVTAMMAFFLLLWLLASTTKEERAGISEYFAPTILGATTGTGSSESAVDLGGGQEISRGEEGKDGTGKIQEADSVVEKERLESLMEELKKSIEQSQALKPFKDQLLLDITHEGLRIQIVDKENRPMFDSGSAELKSYTKEILHELAKTINTVPNKISLTGHTDAALFISKKGYTNWELSADRSNASRRELIIGGLGEEKVAKVVGLASIVPFDKTNPRSPINRRIAIIVMNKAAEEALMREAANISSEDEAKQVLENIEQGSTQPGAKGLAGSLESLRPSVKQEEVKLLDTKASSPSKSSVEKQTAAETSMPQKPEQKTEQKKPASASAPAVELAPEEDDQESVIPLINPIQLPAIPGG